jgi:hypothetical protein
MGTTNASNEPASGRETNASGRVTKASGPASLASAKQLPAGSQLAPGPQRAGSRTSEHAQAAQTGTRQFHDGGGGGQSASLTQRHVPTSSGTSGASVPGEGASIQGTGGPSLPASRGAMKASCWNASIGPASPRPLMR